MSVASATADQRPDEGGFGHVSPGTLQGGSHPSNRQADNIMTEGVPPHYLNNKRALDAGVVRRRPVHEGFESISETHVLDGVSVAANAFAA